MVFKVPYFENEHGDPFFLLTSLTRSSQYDYKWKSTDSFLQIFVMPFVCSSVLINMKTIDLTQFL